MPKAGGLIVYSTCSLNPVENEAVLTAALNPSSGEFSIVDVSDQLPGLIQRPGTDTWTVAIDKDGTTQDTFEEYEKASAEKSPPKRLLPTLWPPMRILPQDQDTGGSLLPCFRKYEGLTRPQLHQKTLHLQNGKRGRSRWPAGRKRTKADGEEETQDTSSQAYREQPFYYIDEDNKQVKEGLKTLNMLPSIPLPPTLCPSILKHHNTERIRLINRGTKVIAGHSTGGSSRAFHFLHDGVSLVLLAGYNPTFEELQEPLRTVLQSNTGTIYLLCIERVQAAYQSPLWKAAKSASLLLNNKARSAVSLRIFGEDLSPAGKEQGKRSVGRRWLTEDEPTPEGVNGEQENKPLALRDGIEGGVDMTESEAALQQM
ncbi:hypothetical protein CALVIDRAFT_603247 [Calocera viscosa TUFC12733]|uniref:SAM-dependent MTase RsmB/NOP-type domain-containing protein n=1 Tax=Calocera viscosa (strain TUFC12733) TaxID=1330018 RepID=A0A167FZH3_CALVF|nr:hypothetical protein CALVIDRAFT_603247 [Calocera viscosa TUFC12733]